MLADREQRKRVVRRIDQMAVFREGALCTSKASHGAPLS